MCADIHFYLTATQQVPPFIFLGGFIWNKHFLSIHLKVLYAKKKSVWYSFAFKKKVVRELFLEQAVPRNSSFYFMQKFNSNDKAVYFEIHIYACNKKKMDYFLGLLESKENAAN